MNHKPNNQIRIAAGALGLLVLGALGGRALATGAPSLSPLTYTGVVTDKTGKPWPTAVPVSVAFYDKADATVAKCTSPTVQAEAGTGRFSVVLPAECAQAVHDTPDLWAEPVVGDTKTVLPRTHVGAVPYALEADSAKTAAVATGALKTSLDGLAADIATLKSAAGSGKGGAPQVFDGAGALLGTLVHIGPATDQTTPRTALILSPTGYLYERRLDGSPAEQGFWYPSANCVGAPALEVWTAATLANMAVWEPIGQKWYLVTPPGGKNYCDANQAYYNGKSRASTGNGLCVNYSMTQNAKACTLTATTATALGIPASIAPGLSVKAP